jgi:diamine N-acetyltransferase
VRSPSADTLTLCAIGPKNHEAVRALGVGLEQTRFVASVEKSLADAYVWPDAVFRAAFSGNTPVGYVLLFPFEEDGIRLVNIVRLMIDADHQGQGLGRALLRETVRWIGTWAPAVQRVRISTLPDNVPALTLYRTEGFEEAGTEEGEVVLYRDLTPPADANA